MLETGHQASVCVVSGLSRSNSKARSRSQPQPPRRIPQVQRPPGLLCVRNQACGKMTYPPPCGHVWGLSHLLGAHPLGLRPQQLQLQRRHLG
jgi:hypothetical protein